MGVAAAAAFALFTSPALADPSPSPGSDAAVEQARREERMAAASVAELESLLSALQGETEAAQAKAALAAEAYNKAQGELAIAAADAEAARDAAESASGELDKARGALARVALMNTQAGTGISQLEPLLSADGFEEALERSTMLYVVGSAADRAAKKFAQAKQQSEQAGVRADAAVDLWDQKAATAESRADEAQRAADSALQAEQEAQAQHQRLLEVLAEKRQTTVEAEAASERQRQAEANRKAQEEKNKPPSGGGGTTNPPPGGGGTNPPPSDPGGGTDPGGGGTDPGGGGTNPGTGTSGAAAVAWARAQIGKPYAWGGSGPNSFDCSGLTSGAWLNGGGKRIPRVAADQYYAAQKIPYSSMQVGDLIFWDRTGSGIDHVAIFSGNGKMIEAPRPGLNVREIAIPWANTMPYAGRP
jgi:cell wall-associated NlpC family hydrolase